MAATSDAGTVEVLSRTVGARLLTVAAQRYPGYPAYSGIIAMFGGDFSIRLDLCAELIAPKFEVFVVRARECARPVLDNEWDRIELGGFAVARVFVLRRREWTRQLSEAGCGTVGHHPVEQRIGQLNETSETSGSVIVDSGVCLLSELGVEICLDADVFPLTFQLHYRVTPSALPESARISIDKWRGLR